MTKNPRVFVVQQPTGRHPTTGDIINTMDLSPAEEWGELVFLLREFENPFTDLQETSHTVMEALDEHDYGDGDYLLLVGNPVLIGIVAACAVLSFPTLNMLQWDRSRGRYNAAPSVDMEQVFDECLGLEDETLN